ncbi:hypothetical protein, partial [Xanthomonas hortorum]
GAGNARCMLFDHRGFGLLFNASGATNKLLRKQPTHSLARRPYRLRDRVAAWMPQPSLQGWIHGVSRER